MQVFNKGNDIETTLEAFSDSSLKALGSFADYDITIMLYTSKGGKSVYCSTRTENKDVQITVVSPSVMKVTLNKELFYEMRDGEVTYELRLINKTSGLCSLVVENSFIIEDSETSRQGK